MSQTSWGIFGFAGFGIRQGASLTGTGVPHATGGQVPGVHLGSEPGRGQPPVNRVACHASSGVLEARPGVAGGKPCSPVLPVQNADAGTLG